MKHKILILSIVSSLCLIGGNTQRVNADYVTDPTPVADSKWCRAEEEKLAKNLKLPKGFEEKSSGKLRALVSFHLKDGHVTNLKAVRKTKKQQADWPTITIPEKQYAEIEQSMIAAVRATLPMQPLPPALSDSGVSFAYEPNGGKRIRVILFMDNP